MTTLTNLCCNCSKIRIGTPSLQHANRQYYYRKSHALDCLLLIPLNIDINSNSSTAQNENNLKNIFWTFHCLKFLIFMKTKLNKEIGFVSNHRTIPPAVMMARLSYNNIIIQYFFQCHIDCRMV